MIYLLNLFHRNKWNKVRKFSFATKHDERHACAVSLDAPVPMDVVPSCGISVDADVKLEEAMPKFCQLFEKYVNWGTDQCEQKFTKRMKKIMIMCTISEKVMARIARRNN